MRRLSTLFVICVIACANFARAEDFVEFRRLSSPNGKMIAVLYCTRNMMNCRMDVLSKDNSLIAPIKTGRAGSYVEQREQTIRWSSDSRFLSFVIRDTVEGLTRPIDVVGVYDSLGKYGHKKDGSINVFYPIKGGEKSDGITDVSFSGSRIRVVFNFSILGREANKKCKGVDTETPLYQLTKKLRIEKNLADLKSKEKKVWLKFECDPLCAI